MRNLVYKMFNTEEAKLLDCMKSNKTGPHKSL